MRVMNFCYLKFIGQNVIWVEVKLCMRYDIYIYISREHKENQLSSLLLKNEILLLLRTYLSFPWRVKSSKSIHDLSTMVQSSWFLLVCLSVLNEFFSKLSVALARLWYTCRIQCILCYVCVTHIVGLPRTIAWCFTR